MKISRWAVAALALSAPAIAFAQTAVNPKYTYLTFAVFAAIIGITMYITNLAAKRTTMWVMILIGIFCTYQGVVNAMRALAD